MRDYTIENGQYYKVTDKKSGDIVSFGELNIGDILSTIHNVEFLSKDDYDALHLAADEANEST